MAKLLNHSHIKALIKETSPGKRVAADAMAALEICVREKVEALARTHNGGLKTISATLVHYTFKGSKQ